MSRQHVRSSPLADWGWDEELAELAKDLVAPGRIVARVLSEDRLGYTLQGERGELRGVLPGKIRRAASVGEALRPAVGDWVLVEDRPGQDGLPVVEVVPRRSKLSRKAAGLEAVEQVVGANVDVAFLVTSIDSDLSPRRLERYRAICEEGGVRPVVVLTKLDLVDDPSAAIESVRATLPGVDVHAVSNVDGRGVSALDGYLERGRTLALLGSSGVGKSTIVNRWIGDLQATYEVDEHGKGRHTTTARSLFATPSGALVMDTPGMRELALWDAGDGVRATFADCVEVASHCKFRDCEHEAEPGCAIRAAIEAGTLDRQRVESWKKLEGELAAVDLRRAQQDDKRHAKLLSRGLRAQLKRKGR
ncbi:MAG: ribosome small subunit-dependent GTPase A [Polyangiales bacterium]